MLAPPYEATRVHQPEGRRGRVNFRHDGEVRGTRGGQLAALARDGQGPWKQMSGLKRLQLHLRHILTHSLAGEKDTADAHTASVLRGQHQVATRRRRLVNRVAHSSRLRSLQARSVRPSRRRFYDDCVVSRSGEEARQGDPRWWRRNAKPEARRQRETGQSQAEVIR